MRKEENRVTEREMPVVANLASSWRETLPLKELRVAACLHVTAETAVLARALKAGGAEVRLCASNL